MRHAHRKTAPGVRDGRVRRKNNWDQTPDYDITPQARVFIDRQRPGTGYRHLLLKRDVERFIALLPDWDELSRGLNAIVLAPGSPRLLGYYRDRVVSLCAWERALEGEWHSDFIDEHRLILALLDVPMGPAHEGPWRRCRFTEATARGFQLLHVLLHELGHHHDQMTTRARRHSCRGEGFAEDYANGAALRVFGDYVAAFGL